MNVNCNIVFLNNLIDIFTSFINHNDRQWKSINDINNSCLNDREQQANYMYCSMPYLVKITTNDDGHGRWLNINIGTENIYNASFSGYSICREELDYWVEVSKIQFSEHLTPVFQYFKDYSVKLYYNNRYQTADLKFWSSKENIPNVLLRFNFDCPHIDVKENAFKIN